jgi:hypothetical protein
MYPKIVTLINMANMTQTATPADKFKAKYELATKFIAISKHLTDEDIMQAALAHKVKYKLVRRRLTGSVGPHIENDISLYNTLNEMLKDRSLNIQ